MTYATDPQTRRAKELWETTPLEDREWWCVFFRHRVHLARRRTFRKYLKPNGDWTEDRFKAAKFDSEAVAREWADRQSAKTGKEWLVDRWKP